MAQVGVVFAVLTRTGLDAITLALEVEQAACPAALKEARLKITFSICYCS